MGGTGDASVQARRTHMAHTATTIHWKQDFDAELTAATKAEPRHVLLDFSAAPM
jgi:hypothetical protein